MRYRSGNFFPVLRRWQAAAALVLLLALHRVTSAADLLFVQNCRRPARPLKAAVSYRGVPSGSQVQSMISGGTS